MNWKLKSHSELEILEAIVRGEEVWALDTANAGEDDTMFGDRDDIIADVLGHFELESFPENWSLDRVDDVSVEDAKRRLTLAKLTEAANAMNPNAKHAALDWIAAIREGNVYSPEELTGFKLLLPACPGKLAYPHKYQAFRAVEDSANYIGMNWKQPAARLFANAIRDFGWVVKGE